MFAYKGGKNYTQSNSLTLLTDGDQFYPRLIKRIRKAKHEIFLETFILAEDRVGTALKTALLQAAKRGVWISITADSYGTFFLKDDYINELGEAGVIFQIYDPQPQWFHSRPKLFRRLHRKLAVIDNTYAFIGGINFCEDHLTKGNKSGKRDYAVEVCGPVVADIRKLCQSYVRECKHRTLEQALNADINLNHEHLTTHKNAKIAFVSRDNRRNRSEIEKGYLAAIRNANTTITIANAYFFPGFRVMRGLRKASARGVKVRLILQGNPDIPFALRAAQCLYDTLIRHGIEIYEYIDRPLHAKIATIDDEWSSIGSSNLDPWSLALNLEANLFVLHKEFNRELTEKMQGLMKHSRKVEYKSIQQRDWLAQLRNTLLYHILRRLPGLISWIPNSYPSVKQVRRIYKAERGASKDRELNKAYPESKHAHQVIVETRHQTLEETQ